MKLSELLPREHIVAPLNADTVREGVAVLIDRLVEQGLVRDREIVERGLNDRRARDLVLIGPEVALPHYRTHAVSELAIALGMAPRTLRRPEGLESSVRILALILAPPQASTLYLQTVSALARLFRQDGVVQAMLAARSPDDILALTPLADVSIQPRLTVRDIMLQSLDSVSPDTPVRDAVDLMIQRRLRALPVLNEKREVLGIISEFDVMRGLLPQIPRSADDAGLRPAETQLRVRDIMTRSVLCISEELGLDEAASMMINKDVEQFPVVSEGKLTGFLTRSELIRKLFGR